jgi:hypothetical protein
MQNKLALKEHLVGLDGAPKKVVREIMCSYDAKNREAPSERR